jgi:hypothetical protein
VARVADPGPAAIDRHLAPELRSVLEERFWRPMVEGSTWEALRDHHALGLGSSGHPALFADHGIVHVRDVAAGVVDLAATVDGILLPRRPSDRREFVVGLAVIIAYVHDVGMYDPTPTGRRIHALYGAHFPFSGDMDDVIDRLRADAGPVVGRIAAVDAAAPFGVSSDVILRELISLSVAHSKSAVPAALLADVTALKRLMRHIILRDLDQHRRAEALPAPEDAMADGAGANARWYADPIRHPYAWLDSPEAAHRALADDAIDAVRLVRAADALRQRGTTLRTSAGYEIFIDAESGSAVFALRSEGNDRLFLVRVASPVNAGEANLRRAFVTPHGNLRVAFHRGRFSSASAATVACEATASAVADVGADVLGAFAFRRPSPDLGEPRCRGSAMRVEIERPADEPAFADQVVAALASRDPSLAPQVAVVADLESAAPAERARYLRGIAVPADGDEATRILRALGDRGLKVAAIDRHRAFEDVRRVGLQAGEVLVEAGTWPAFVYIAVEPGLMARPLGGYAHDDVPEWFPIGVTGVVRRAERNAAVVAVAAVEVLMIPGELFVREWFHPYDEEELAGLLARIGGG